MIKHGNPIWIIIAITGLFIITASSSPAEAFRFETVLDNESLWAATADKFVTPDNAMFYRWTSGEKDTLRFPGYSNSPEMSFLGTKCWEVQIRFASGKVEQVSISLYNRGDAGEITVKADFDKLLKGIEQNIDQWTGTRSTASPRSIISKGMFLDRKTWKGKFGTLLELKSSASDNIQSGRSQNIKFRAEYIHLAVHRPGTGKDMSSSFKKPGMMNRMSLKQNLKKDENGFTYISNLPMVDQGQKGYCAVATTERILKYYGSDADQHILAQIADSSSTGGTNPMHMIDVLRKLGLKLGVKVSIHEEFTIKSFVEFVQNYNREAGKSGKREIELSNPIDISRVYLSMDPGVIKTVRTVKGKSGMNKFKNTVTQNISAGMPCAWSVMLGIVPEEPRLPQAAGGHMRIIHGINPKSSEILYSDSWGAGHEKKTMSLENAWTITTGLYTFEPRS
jgi:hypothetical protein